MLWLYPTRRPVRVLARAESYWRTGQDIVLVEYLDSGKIRLTLASRLRASGGQEEIDEAIREAEGE